MDAALASLSSMHASMIYSPKSFAVKLAIGNSSRTFCCSTKQNKRDFLQVEGVSYRPPGTEVNLLDHVTFRLPEKRPYIWTQWKRKNHPSPGCVTINKPLQNETEQGLTQGNTGIVFQFPERYFLADSVLDELTFGLPTQSQDPFIAHQLFVQLNQVALAVGLSGIPWDANPRSLSDGYKRRLALAVQLVRKPHLLLLDEPLAGLDWRARTDVAKILASLKQELTLIVVSHDLKELTPFVDKAWRMDPGGRLTEASVPLQ